MRVVRSVVPLVIVALCTTVSAEKKARAKYSQATGPITAVDADAKTITVKTRKAEKTITIAEKTTIIRVQLAKAADLAKGQMVRVDGKVAEDQKSVAARRITILPEKSKPRGKGVTKTGALGTVESTGDTLSLKTADGATITITLVKEPRATMVLKAAKATFGDLKKGANVQCNTAIAGDTTRATRVTIRPAEMAARKAKKKDK